jgi:hypothetical protein
MASTEEASNGDQTSKRAINTMRVQTSQLQRQQLKTSLAVPDLCMNSFTPPAQGLLLELFMLLPACSLLTLQSSKNMWGDRQR